MPDARGAPRAGVAGIVARWRPWAGDGLEHLVLHERPDGVVAESAVVADDFAARYRIVCDAAWRTRRLEVAVIGAERGLTLAGDGHGRWTDAAGAAMPGLNGALDVDLTLTPFTNTLPIRRLRLDAGRSADILVAYVQPSWRSRSSGSATPAWSAAGAIASSRRTVSSPASSRWTSADWSSSTRTSSGECARACSRSRSASAAARRTSG